MTPAPDQAARERALDVDRSVIVQAPAGSGKTTLLVQRYLRLLGRASRPEEILAITFTRKAAAEMRGRVLEALRRGAPEAADALRRDQESGWRLTEQPNRLKIQTIDSFASALVRQLPLTAEFRPGAELVEDASEAYRQAVDRLFQRLYRDDPLGPELAVVLALFDNDYATTRSLLAGMLARRDQWLDLVRGVVQLGRHEPGRVRQLVESAVRELGRRVVAELEACLDDSERRILHDAVRHAADRLGERLGGGDDVYRLAGRLLVTSQGTLRRRLTRQQGFPPEDALRKAALTELIERLDARGYAPLFDNLRALPANGVDEAAAESLTSLCITLMLAALELDALLLERGQADFTQLVLAASRALADGDAPTELALALDYRIRHVLVDEFQDTSESQLRFFTLLVQGWSPGDGNTFFAVGDPMQSIYRFRNADVRVFYDAWQHGIGPVPLEPVRLSANFRASPRLVDWYNSTFAAVMGAADDPLLGRVAYSPAVAARRDAGGVAGTAVHCALLERGQADFTQLVLAASRALADGDAPNELALALDYRIRHVLVDEFQDTSESQLRFFTLLVQGWSPGDGNT
ncbi:MAG TPA: UvrD-helicase domain-containing protein, partial [Pseudomonadales bacterium]